MAKDTKDTKKTTLSAKEQKHVEEGEHVHRFFEGIHRRTSNIQKEFVEFINRGSIIDLAIGVAVGGAFNTIVNSFVNDIIMPIVGLIAGGVDFNNLAIRIPNFFGANDAATISYGKFLQACLQFFIVAWVFFLLVKTMNGIHRKREDELVKIGKAIEKSEEQLASKLDSQAKKDSKSRSTKLKSKIESKAESALKADAAARHEARKKKAAAAEKAAAEKAQKAADSASSSSTKSSSSSSASVDAFLKKL